MKKVLGFLVAIIAIFALASCESGSFEIAMITDTGDIDDGSFNQGTWEGIKEYAKANKKSHKYYKPGGETTGDYEAAIDLAVSKGAKIIITPGFYFEVPIFNVQDKYPEVKFVLLDGSPNNGDFEGDFQAKVGDNTLAIFFKEEQAGFLAGYAAIKEGFTKLGYMGGIAVPAVQRFGIGWVAGAYQAASELEITSFEFKAEHYTYLGSFGPNDEFKTMAASWFSSGVEVIHAAAGGAGSSVMAAAEDTTGKWVVGVDSDQAKASDTVLSSATKGVGEAAYKALEAFYKDEFPGGETWNLGVDDDSVSLPMTTSRFETFTNDDYTALFNKLVNKTYVAPTTADELETFIKALPGFTNVNLDALKGKI